MKFKKISGIEQPSNTTHSTAASGTESTCHWQLDPNLGEEFSPVYFQCIFTKLFRTGHVKRVFKNLFRFFVKKRKSAAENLR